MIRKFAYMFAAMGLMTLCGCNHTKQKAYLDTPSIYKAWDARYQYDSSKRQLIPLYDNQQVGRAWGRDPNGRMNYALYYDGKGKPKENLLALHKQKLDQERGRRWDELNQERIERISERLLGQAEKEEVVEETEPVDAGMDFLPTPFIPAGLDMNMESDSSGDSPFTPLSIEEDSSTGGGEMAEPSPFLPLEP